MRQKLPTGSLRRKNRRNLKAFRGRSTPRLRQWKEAAERAEGDREESGEAEDPDHVRAEERQAERSRCAEITALCRQFDIPDDEIRRYLSDGTSIGDVREAIIDRLARERAPISQRGNADITLDAADKFRAAAGDALVMRSGD